MRPQLSVIIPTYKRSESLKKLIEALLAQHAVDLQIIVVDQNVPTFFDNQMIDLLNRVTWVKQEIPNASDARNRGFHLASASYLLFVDDDLIPEPDFCRQGINLFEEYASIGSFVPLVYSYEGEAAAVQAAERKRLSTFRDRTDIFSISDTISASIFFRKEFYYQTGGFDKFLFTFAKTAEDQEFFLRMGKKKMNIWFVPNIKIFHDEKVAGGCDLRTDDYWITREKCMRAWALRYRTLSSDGTIRTADFFKLLRSCVINREVLTSSPKAIARQAALIRKAVKDSGKFYADKKALYRMRLTDGFLADIASDDDMPQVPIVKSM